MLIGINVGSGQRPFHSTPEVEWINLDRVPDHNPDVLGDAAKLPYPEGYFDYVVSHHCHEHITSEERGCAIREAWRVLKIGGSYIVTVPDMPKVCQMYLNHEYSEDPAVNTHTFLCNVYGAYTGNQESTHKWGFDSWSLFSELRGHAPWSRINIFDWRPIPGADIARDDRWILGVEGVK